jgi:hypothetical protein
MSAIRIHQIHFRPEQKAHLEPAFIPFDNAASPAPEQMEYRVFRDGYQRGLTREADYTGFVSWKFRQKTRVTGDVFVDFIRDNPGYDVYFINPFPAELLWRNVWVQGETFHPGLLGFAQTIFDRLDYDIRLASLDNLADTAAYCNYWVGSSEFWDRYMEFTEPIYDHLVNDLSAAERELLWSRADRQIEASYFPFIFERMFSTLLASDSSIKAHAYRYSEPALRARFQPHIADMILAAYDLEDESYEEASKRLLSSLRRLHAAERMRRERKPSLERWLRRALRRLGR